LFASAQHVGFFGAADRIANLGISLMTPANQVLVGTVSRRLAIGSRSDDAFVLMRKSLVAMLAFGFAAMAVSIALAPWAVPLVMGAEFGPSVVLVQVLGVVFPFAAFNQAARMYVLIPLRHDAAVARVSIIGALITWVAIGLFVTRWGGMGVVIAKIVGELAVTLATIAVMLRDFELRSIFSRRGRDRRQEAGGVDT
jgi:PST family polysaccharide transporter